MLELNLLNSVRKIQKPVALAWPAGNIALSSIITSIEKYATNMDARLRNYCPRKGLGFIDNKNINENYLVKNETAP